VFFGQIDFADGTIMLPQAQRPPQGVLSLQQKPVPSVPSAGWRNRFGIGFSQFQPEQLGGGIGRESDQILIDQFRGSLDVIAIAYRQ
jgi:hypothetical protein